MDEQVINRQLGLYQGMLGDTRTEVALTPERLAYLRRGMGLDYGNETEGPEIWGEAPKSDWTSYRTFPEAVGEFARLQAERAIGPIVRAGDVLRGRNPYGSVDEINTPSVVREAAAADVMGAVGVAATPGMFGSRAGATSTVSALGGRNYKDQLLSKQDELIKGIGAVKQSYDDMIVQTDKILKLAPPMIDRIKVKFQTAYDAAREAAGGGSWVDIAVLRDKLGLSQEKMADLLRRGRRDGNLLLEKGERSVVDEYTKGGAVDDMLLVRLEPEFFDNIGKYIKGSVKR